MASLSELVKELREKTGAGILDCQKALTENGNSIDKAIDYLRQKGLAAAQKKAGRETNQGLIHAYIHAGGKIGVLIEVNCETDFVARTDDFQNLVRDAVGGRAAVGAGPLHAGAGQRLITEGEMGDWMLLLLFGIIGYGFIKLGCEPAPLLLGFILGPMMEENLRRALLLSRGDWTTFLTRPLSAGLLLAATAMIVVVMLPSIKKKREETFKEED